MEKPVTKFYAQSGQLSWVFLSTDVESAAVRFAQFAFQEAMLGQQTITASISMVDEAIFAERCRLLGKKVLISQQGFGGPKVGIFDTIQVVNRWRSQINALEALIRKMA